MRSRTFLLGLAGGVVGTALVLLVLVLVFGFGDVKQQKIVVQTGDAGGGVSYTPAPGQGLSPQQIYRQHSAGVVMVLSDFPASSGQLGVQASQALGTGFVVDEQGDILTNAHVVDESGRRARRVTVVFNKGGSETQRVKGALVGVDQSSDVALIKVDPAGLSLRPLPLGNSDAVAVGAPVVAIGNPLGYDFSITSGIVSAVGRTLQAPNGMRIPDGIQTDAAINQGNSGGPLIDGAGKVIGINEQIASQGGGNDGLGFAVPINTAVRVMTQLKKSGAVTYAWLGVAGQTLTSDVAAMFGLKASSGALVEQVSAGSPAAAAGIKGGTRTVTVQGAQYTIGGDIIIAADGKTITTFDELLAIIDAKRPGDKLGLTLQRGDKTLQVTTTLATRPSNF
jgi:S1-C subfamily serine protease